MNANRRKLVSIVMEKLNQICAKIEDVREDLDLLRDEEYDSYTF